MSLQIGSIPRERDMENSNSIDLKKTTILIIMDKLILILKLRPVILCCVSFEVKIKQHNWNVFEVVLFL